jgi:two-component system, OmpR family, sensor kinase
MKNSLGARILVLVAGGALLLSIVLALIAHTSYRSYYVEVMANRAAGFAERVLSKDPDFWETYQRVPGQFSERMQSLITYEPNTGLYVVSLDGQVLATAGEGKLFWGGTYRVDIAAVKQAASGLLGNAVYGSDPDSPNLGCIISARPIMHEGTQKAWLYVVARNADSNPDLPNLVRSYAVKGAVKIALITLAIGLLVTIGVLALVARPLSELSRAAEDIRADDFQSETQMQGLAQPGTEHQFPFTDRNDEIGRMARSFEAMVKRLREQAQTLAAVDQGRRSMIAGVSHDLRTPLTALTSQLETLNLKGEQLPMHDRERFMSGALRNASHLRRLTDSLADLSRFDNPNLKAELEPLNIGDLIEDMNIRLSSRAQSEGITLKAEYADGIGLVNADINLLERALTNLIDNAIRVLSAGGQIVIAAVAIDAQKVRISVTDNGPGISEKDQARIFEAFYQTSEHREHRGSAGLGLAIVKRVADLHGTTVGLNSSLGRGCSFWFDLSRA